MWDKVYKWGCELADKFVDMLPFSPFADYIELLAEMPYLGILNWFIPIGQFVTILQLWSLCIITFYGVMAFLRWLKILD